MSKAELIQEARAKIAAIAAVMLSGEVSFIEGSRQICRLRFDAEIADFDDDILAFVVIVSETDALPLGDERRLWNAEALAGLQPEIDHAEEWAKSTGRNACQAMVRRFGTGPRGGERGP